MIHFKRVEEPASFDQEIRIPGRNWLREHPNTKRPRDLWPPFRSSLASGFRDLCGYSAMWIPEGTVDHYISCAEDRNKAYEWDNYRYAAHWINSSKSGGHNESFRVLDPYEVGDGWFEIILPSLQLVVSEMLPRDMKKRAEYTLSKLHLRDDERVIRQRREWYRMYCDGEITLAVLEKKAPLIARAIKKEQQESL